MRKLPVYVSAQEKFATLYIHVCSNNRDKLGFGYPQLFYKTTLINDINFCCVNKMHAVDDYAGIVCCSTLIR